MPYKKLQFNTRTLNSSSGTTLVHLAGVATTQGRDSEGYMKTARFLWFGLWMGGDSSASI